MRTQLFSRPGRLALTLAVGAAVLAGCGGGGGSTAGGGGTDAAGGTGGTTAGAGGQAYKLGCTIPTFSHPFFVAMKKGLEEEAQSAGSSINVVDGKDDPQTQLSAIDTFAVQGVNAIILCPTETETLVPGVEKANSSNIPVVTVNRTVSGGNVVTYVGADDKEGGRLQGQALVQLLPNGGNVVLLQGVLGSSPQRDREAGLEEVLKGHPNIKIIEKVPYKFQRTEAVSRMETVLLQHAKGKIDAVVAQSDDGALAAADVCGRSGRTEIKIVGFNGESEAFDYINAGKMHATVLQDAETQGREAVRATIAHLKGEKVESPKITPLYLIDKTNIKEHKPAWQSASS